MDVATLTTNVRDLLSEATVGFFTDAEIGRWLGLATVDISTLSHCLERRAEIALTLSDYHYAITPAAGETFLEVMHVLLEESGKGLRKITPTMAGEASIDLQEDEPSRWWEWQQRLYIEPRPDVGAIGKNVLVFYTVASEDPTALPVHYQLLAITYAVARGLFKDKRASEAMALYTEYLAGLEFRRADLQQKVPHTESDLTLSTYRVPVGGGAA